MIRIPAKDITPPYVKFLVENTWVMAHWFQPRGIVVELTDPKVIEALMTAVARRKQARHTRKADIKESTSPERRTRCTCGACSACQDNARWEAIFNAKFADPDYYKARPLRSGSSLNFVRPPGRTNAGRSAER